MIYNYLVSTSGSWQPGQLLERITAQRPSVNIKLEQIISVIQNTDVLNSTLPLVALWPSPRGARVISGKSNRLFSPTKLWPTFKSRHGHHGLSKLLVGSLLCSERFFSPGSLVFPSCQKPTRANSNLTRDQVDKEPLSRCATSKSLIICLFIYLFKSYSINFCEWCKMSLPASPGSSDHWIVQQVLKSNK